MSAYRRKNGKYYCRFQVDGKRYHVLCKGAKSLREAERYEVLKISEIIEANEQKAQEEKESLINYKTDQQNHRVEAEPPGKIKLSFLCDYYILCSKDRKKSIRQDICRVAIIENFFNKDKYISDIKPQHVEAFKRYLLDKGRSKVTVNRYLEILSRMFTIAIDSDWLSVSPIKKGMRFPEKNYTVRYLSEDEEERLFKVLPPFLSRITFVALMTGFRKENLLGLTWEQINLEFKYIELLDNKGNKHVRKPINSKLYDFFLETPIEERQGYVFINPLTGDRCRDIRRPWKKALQEADISNLRFHDLRHTVATRLVKQGVPLPVVKEVLDHSDIKTTMRYNHIGNKQVVDAMELLGSDA